MHSGVQNHIQINIWHIELLKFSLISVLTKGLSKFMLNSGVLLTEKKLQNFDISYGTENVML